MLTILGGKPSSFCDGMSRRNFLRAGALGVGGLSLPQVLRAEVASKTDAGSVVMVYLPGGPTQHETFDPKPNAPVEIRGAYQPIATRVPGVQFCELLTKLAKISDRFSVVRTLVGMQNRHESFQCYTGRPGGRISDGEPSGGWPSLGSVVSKVLGPRDNGTIPYVDAAPKMGYGPYNNSGLHDASAKRSWPGYTGASHIPFTLDGEVKSDLVINGDNALRLGQRRALLTALGRHADRLQPERGDRFQQQAFDVLTSSRLSEALDLERESKRMRQWYGEPQNTDPSFGGAPQSPSHLLLARRLVEAGVRCVTVALGAWDWHANREGPIAQLARKYLPVFDHSLAVFLEDLHQRGMLESTTVVVWGEFGRTPRINAKGGRDHWPSTQSILLAGGGIQGGRIVGQTDRDGGAPMDRPVHVQEVFATLYRGVGIDTNRIKVADFNGRPRYLVDAGRQPISELY